MGWWDDARAHPHALRWSELERLYSYWLDESVDCMHPSAAFLLLSIFVGNGANERDEFRERKLTIASHFARLGLFTEAEISELADRTFVLPLADDYRWSYDQKLGWLFGGEYPCYSLRNREHSAGSEGRFPFSDWSEVIAALPPPSAL